MTKALLLVLCALPLISWSQDGSEPPASTPITTIELGAYFWKTKVPMKEVFIDGSPTDSPAKVALSQVGQSFDVINILKDGVVVQIGNYTEGTPAYNLFNNRKGGRTNNSSERSEPAPGTSVALSGPIVASDPDQRYFLVSKEDIARYSQKHFRVKASLAFGVINFPFKYRLTPKRADFTGAFNFGAALGAKLGHDGRKGGSWSIITGYSISNVVLEKLDVRRNEASLSETNNFTSFSFSFGPMFEHSRVQVGAFLGFDSLSRLNQDHFGWRHQGKPWFSIGFGYAIFSKQEQKDAANAKN